MTVGFPGSADVTFIETWTLGTKPYQWAEGGYDGQWWSVPFGPRGGQSGSPLVCKVDGQLFALGHCALQIGDEGLYSATSEVHRFLVEAGYGYLVTAAGSSDEPSLTTPGFVALSPDLGSEIVGLFSSFAAPGKSYGR